MKFNATKSSKEAYNIYVYTKFICHIINKTLETFGICLHIQLINLCTQCWGLLNINFKVRFLHHFSMDFNELKIAEMPVPHSLGKYFQHHEI